MHRERQASFLRQSARSSKPLFHRAAIYLRSSFMAGFRLTSSSHNVNLWIVPLKMSLAAVALFVITITPDMLAAYHVIHIPDWFTMGGIDDARAILSAMLGCVSTVLALIFSVALLVLSMVANLFGPRLLYRFVQDWVTQACIGLFMGAFIYVFLVFLVTHKDEHTSFIPQVSLITSWFLVLAAFGFLVFYSHRVAVLIQNPDAIGRIVDDLRRAVKLAAPYRKSKPHLQQLDASESHRAMTDSAAMLSPASGYLQEINHQALVSAAARAGALISVPFRPGQFVLQGETLASISPASKLASLTPLVSRSITMGRHRVLCQDLEFGVAQIVEIAIRALSPAINDTFTGIASVDLLGEALTILAETPQCSGRWFDTNGKLRLQVRPLLLPRLVKQAFDQIRQAAADNPAVLIRLLSTIGRLAPKLQGAEDRSALVEQAAAVWETANTRPLVNLDREDIEAAWQKTRTALAPLAVTETVGLDVTP
jgi:uncharacterized membrane protein